MDEAEPRRDTRSARSTPAIPDLESARAADPSAKKGEEARLRESEARLRALISSMLDPTISIDAFGNIQEASESVLRVFGYAPAELIGQNIKLLMPEPHRSHHDEYLANYRRTGHTWIIGRTRDFEIVRKDGSRLVCALSVSRVALPAGKEAVFTGTFRDVTELRRVADALVASERRFHAIFDQAFQFLGLLEPDGTVLEANQTALDATGARREDVVGKPFWETRWWSFSQASKDCIRAAIQAAAAGAFVRFEVEVRGQGDTVLDVDFSLKPVKDESGRVVLIIPEGRNITEIKRAQRAETAMLRALANIGESAAILAHEIKNPITAVNVALRAVADQLGENHKEVLEDLVSRMQRLEQLMRRTLSFARPLDLKRARIDARKLFDDSQAHLREAIETTEARVRTEVDPAGVRFTADSQLMEEVFANLITNAIEAKERGAHIQLSAARERDGTILLAVEDDGPGIPESVRASLFKPFMTTKKNGNGLGLAICRKIVEEHGGTLRIADGRPSGTRFEIRLPSDS